MIIDIYGLPGSGKSTISVNLQKQLSKMQEKQIYYFNANEYDHSGKQRFNKDLKFYLSLLNNSFFKMYKEITKQIIKSHRIKYKNFKEKLRDSLRLSILYSTINNNSYNNDIIIIDQGLIQDFIELMIKYDIKDDKIIDNYIGLLNSANNNNLYYIYCNVSKKECTSRIKKRNRNKFDFDFLTESELNDYFEKENMLIKKINKKLNGKIFIINDNNTEVLNKITEYIGGTK